MLILLSGLSLICLKRDVAVHRLSAQNVVAKKNRDQNQVLYNYNLGYNPLAAKVASYENEPHKLRYLTAITHMQ